MAGQVTYPATTELSMGPFCVTSIIDVKRYQTFETQTEIKIMIVDLQTG